ncbi:long-chain fatty acid--CoA ligase [Phreatobacter aquaticus]|uniref:3-methylmercaptopropionyl-CoA ligase n=1 Tax=Phreatobacter aquaticus TaxID=2570229 RepID=A0A4D7QFP5_9HYPH|nr:long-chain fatty acid--CoA ligase [Phreatobacter aquaticus]QCK84629.1 long-chain fatty acid--CoA ligase [Phreatobacter aquaticus]
MKTIPDLCRRRAELTPDKTAFAEIATGRRFTFAEIDAHVGQAAALFASLGLGEGDRIAVLCHNRAAFFEILFACARAKIILVPLNWRQTPAELAPILADCRPKLLIADEPTWELAERLASPALTLMSFADYETRRDATPTPSGPVEPWDTDRVWYLLYTSGTTGAPKAVIQTPGMALANAVNIQQGTGMGPDDQTLNFLPLFHTAGINLHALPLFIQGGLSHIIPKFEPDIVLYLIAAGNLTLFFGVPAIYQAISLHPRFATTDFSSVRSFGCGGAPLSESLIRAFLDRGVMVCNGMGMTETGPTVFFMDQAHALQKIGSVGKPQILAEVRLVDIHDRDVPRGERGELLFRGPGITPGYFNNPAATEKAFAPGGWLRSGDVGRQDEDGYFYLVDRIKDMFISGGENVYPAEVEIVLHAHPAVLEAAVLGVPDAKWGEVGHAVIVLRPGMTSDVETLKAHARAHLAAYKVPKHVTLVEDFPRTAAGKIQKHVLRAIVAGGTLP